MERKRWTRTAAGGAVLAGAGLLMRSEYEKKHFRILTYEIHSGRLDPAFAGDTSVFLSDLHGNSFGDDNRLLTEAVRKLAPDRVLIGGDMITSKPWRSRDFGPLYRLLAALGEICPVFCADGNHEARIEACPERYPGWQEEYLSVLEKTGTIHLADTAETVRKGGGELVIYGLSIPYEIYRDKWRKRLPSGEMDRRLGPVRQEGFRLLLAHTPCFAAEYAAWGADLTLAGHMHGGTVRLPGGRGLMTPQFQFFSRYTKDFILEGDMPLIISAGLGTHSVNVRLNNPPQLVVLKMMPETDRTSGILIRKLRGGKTDAFD